MNVTPAAATAMLTSTMKVILITGATDGLGLEAARKLVMDGHHVLLHGRNKSKLASIQKELSLLSSSESSSTTTMKPTVETYRADLSDLKQVETMANKIRDKHDRLDCLINNAGVFMTNSPRTQDGLDVRFAVNLIAPYVLTKKLLPIIPSDGGRVINLSSAAQSRVNLYSLQGDTKSYLSDGEAYAQSKLGIIEWTYVLSQQVPPTLTIVAVNPGSFLGTKMVKEGYGMDGKDTNIGSDIIVQAAVPSYEKHNNPFHNPSKSVSGKYFDNDRGTFAPVHGLTLQKSQQLVSTMDSMLQSRGIDLN